MTMKPKAKKFRIRRSAPLTSAGGAGDHDVASAAQPVASEATGTTDQVHTGEVASAAEVSTETGIDAIRREGLTGRQLRMARRVAQRNGLAPTSDFDAVRLLREQGIDPFQRANMLELVVPGAAGGVSGGAKQTLPQTVPPAGKNLPSNEVLTEDMRIREIRNIQRDIVRRRRKKTMMLMVRLAFFVGLPTLLAGYYYYVMATPLYATKSEFVIQQAQAPGAGKLGGLLSGTSFATSQDSIAVQSYLESRDAMMRLDADEGFKAHFSQPNIDPLQRLEKNSSNEAAYKLYKRNVKLGYDPSEGIIRMEVIAADPDTSRRFSEALISYAEARVDNLTRRLRTDQMAGAVNSFKDAEDKMRAAQTRVIKLKEATGVVDGTSVVSTRVGQISSFELQLAQKKLALQGLLSNQSPNRARVAGLEGDIKRTEALIAQMQSELTTSGKNNESLARTSSELLVAEAELQTRQMMLSQALQQLEMARIDANRQTRYLSLGVSPVPPDEPTYPRSFEDTVLAFLIFSGIYLMLSLTASILREQVTS